MIRMIVKLEEDVPYLFYDGDKYEIADVIERNIDIVMSIKAYNLVIKNCDDMTGKFPDGTVLPTCLDDSSVSLLRSNNPEWFT